MCVAMKYRFSPLQQIPSRIPRLRRAAVLVLLGSLGLAPQIAAAQGSPDSDAAATSAGLTVADSSMTVDPTAIDTAVMDAALVDAAMAITADAPGIDPAIIKRVAGRTVAMTLNPNDAINDWDWEGGIAIAGLMHAYEATGDLGILRNVQHWTNARLAEGVSITHPNHTTPAWGVLMLYERQPDPRYLAVVERSVKYLIHQAPRVHGTLIHVEDQVWDDTLIVSVPLLARYGARFDCRECLDLAADEYLAHARRLQDPRTGRWYHGWDASDAGAGEFAHLSGAFWARGNGWAALAATELLRFLPVDHPQRLAVIAALDRQLRGLVVMQDRSGLWHTVVDRPDFYLEASGSAAIGAAMLRASAAGWVDPGFHGFGLAARQAVLARVAADGTLTQVSTGTGVAPSVDVYNRVPFDQIKPYGQGLFLILASAGDNP
jgi:unsaturated rhamnogalacturonyl hydrolase